jgi:hypothetical protein
MPGTAYKLSLEITANAAQATATVARLGRQVSQSLTDKSLFSRIGAEFNNGLTKAFSVGGLKGFGANLFGGLLNSGKGAAQAFGMLGTLGKGAFGLISGGATLAASAVKGLFGGALSMATGLLKGFAVAGGLAAAAVYAFSKAIAPAAQMEQYSMALEVMLKSASKAKTRLSDLTEFAKKTPFELPSLIEANNLMQAFGTYSKRNLTAAGNAAAAFGKDIGEVVQSLNYLAAGRGGEAFESLSRFGVTRAKLSKDYGVKFNPKTNELQSSTKEAFAGVIAYFEKNFGGMMQRQSKTLFGAYSNLKDSVTMAFAGGMKGALPATTKVVQILTQGIERVGGLFAKFDWSKIGLGMVTGARAAQKIMDDLMDPKKRAEAFDFAKGFMAKIPEMAGGLAKALAADILATGASLFGNIGTAGALLVEGMKGVFQWAWGGLKEIFSAAWGSLDARLRDRITMMNPFSDAAKQIERDRTETHSEAYRIAGEAYKNSGGETFINPVKLAEELFEKKRGYGMKTASEEAGLSELSVAMGQQGLDAVKSSMAGLMKVGKASLVTSNTESWLAGVKKEARPATDYLTDTIEDAKGSAELDMRKKLPKARFVSTGYNANTGGQDGRFWIGKEQMPKGWQPHKSEQKNERDYARMVEINKSLEDQAKLQTAALQAMRLGIQSLTHFFAGAN